MTPSRDDLVWIAPSVAAGVAVYVIYLATNPYPAHGAGLYLTMAREVSEHGYALPRTIPYYTRGGIPFAYPPLGIYALALVRDATGVGPLALSRWLPGPVVVAALVPTYYLARELLESRPAAAFAATLVAVNPQLLDWHLTAGGLVRAPAFLFATVGLYAGLRRVRSGERRWLAPALACFLLTLLTHPTTAQFLAVSYVVVFVGGLVVDDGRWTPGVVDLLVVVAGGVLLATPWWLTVAATHGPGVFLGATGTHGGLAGGVVERLMGPGAPRDPVVLLLVLGLGLCAVVGVAAGWPLLAAWVLASGFTVSQPRFVLFAGTFLVVAVLLEVGSRLQPPTRRSLPVPPETRNGPSVDRDGPVLVVCVAIVLAALTGAGYVSDDTAAPGPTATPNYLDGADLEAMEWARSGTPPDASFVVLGYAAEWFPLFAERALLVSRWGAEWEGARAYDRHVRAFGTLSRCSTERCLTGALAEHDVRPNYVYVPTGRDSVQGIPLRQTEELVREMERSGRYELVFENERVSVFRVESGPGGDQPRSPESNRRDGRAERRIGGPGDEPPDYVTNRQTATQAPPPRWRDRPRREDDPTAQASVPCRSWVFVTV